MADADTIHLLAEMLFKAAVENDMRYATSFSTQLDLPSRTKQSTRIVPIARLPEELRAKIDESVERNVKAFLDDLDIICKVFDDKDWGRAFHLTLPSQLVGMSWDDVLRKIGEPPTPDSL